MDLREQIRIAIGGALAAQEGSNGAVDAVMEVLAKQEPFAWIVRGGYPVPLDKLEWQLWCGSEKPTLSWVNQEMRPLYALPGAQNVPKAVAYLDLGVGGYMDIGTDLTDEELAALPKGRHMLGVIGTYGVDGYVPAQPAPSDEYVGWYCAHCERGVDASEVTYHEQHQVCGRVITDDRPPRASASVPEGFALVNATHFLAVLDRKDWRTAKNRAELRAMLAAAPEVTIHRAKGEGK